MTPVHDDEPFEATDEVQEDHGQVGRGPAAEIERRLKRDLTRTREQVRAARAELESRVAALLKEKDEAVAAVKTQITSKLIAAELKAHALKAGIVDLDGLRLADMSALAMSEDGLLNGGEALIDKLRLDKPYLFSDQRPGGAVGTTGYPERAPAPAAATPVDARTLSREAWQTEKERLLGRGH